MLQTAQPEAPTASWNGAWNRYPHVFNGRSPVDLYLAFNAAQNRHNLVMIDPGTYNVGYRSSTDAWGGNWNPIVTAAAAGDYPSVAIATNGTIIVGFNQVGISVTGFAVVVSTNSGQTWSGPYLVTGSASQAFGRVVASGNTFHYFFIDTGAHPTNSLRRKASSNGIDWSSPAVTLDTYTAPQSASPGSYCSGANCGHIHYASSLDATGGQGGLGWVVMYPVARTDDPSVNNLKFCAEAITGCTTISYSTDLFLHGVATSPAGDIWFSMHTFAGASDRTLPLRLLGVYRKPDGTFLSGTISSSIDPTSWRHMQYQVGRCGGRTCFSAGDYSRPAMNSYTAATLPFVQQSPRQTDLMQSFLQDPPVGIPPVAGLEIGPMHPFGQNHTSPTRLSLEEIQRRSRTDIPAAHFTLDRRP